MEPFLGQLMLVGFNFAPYQWALAEGQILPIQAYTALFSLLGVNYGGNGTSNFALPNLQGSLALGYGQSTTGTVYDLGEQGGTQTVAVGVNQLPPHNHTVNSDTTPSNSAEPGNNAFAKAGSAAGTPYSDKSDTVAPLDPGALPGFQGGSLPHNNMMPYLTMNWIIALAGIFPARQ